MKDLKIKIRGEQIMIFGCILIFISYTAGIIASFFTPKIYFSDFHSSTLMTLLTVVIFFYVYKDYLSDLEAFKKKRIEFEASKGVVKI
ncbi:MAG: hypothetical protein HWN79_02690 [Candidatus Lokiarchaeota archaeon]|nr:hypothetical protein [Candidatus Lokiarchaeota archaeon]